MPTVGVLTVVFATTNGENISSPSPVPVALVFAGWWAVGPFLALARARPAPIAAAAWVLSLDISLFLLYGLYDTSPTGSSDACGETNPEDKPARPAPLDKEACSNPKRQGRSVNDQLTEPAAFWRLVRAPPTTTERFSN